MKRLFIVIPLVFGIGAAAWAFRQSGNPQAPAVENTIVVAELGSKGDIQSAATEKPACCMKSPSRASLLQGRKVTASPEGPKPE